jgi:catechol 2,3-dioxygenase-like lactoylglutathione lyase family enzyme
MLSSAGVYATIPVVDLKRAERFYAEILGLKVINEDPSPGADIQAGKGTRLHLYQRGVTKADHTVAEFTVKDVEAEVKQLKAKGVKFEDYDIPSMGIKTVNGIATMSGFKGAWFKDTEGNILSITNQ